MRRYIRYYKGVQRVVMKSNVTLGYAKFLIEEPSPGEGFYEQGQIKELPILFCNLKRNVDKMKMVLNSVRINRNWDFNRRL